MKNTYLSHDSSIDDFVAMLCLLAMDDVRITGIGVINADGYIDPGVSVTRKIADLYGKYPIEVAASCARPVNQFPRIWREEAYRIDSLPILNDLDELRTPLVKEVAHKHMIAKIRAEKEKTTVFAIGPLSDLAMAVKEAPDIIPRIERLIWMGGSFSSHGNVVQPDHDGSAEWNAFWDPPAVAEVFSSGIDITMVPTRVTDKCPWKREMNQQWSLERKYEVLDLCGQMYAGVTNLSPYYFWDTLAAAYYGKPDLATVIDVECEVHIAGRSRGRIEEKNGGKKVTILDTVNPDAVFEYVTALLKSFGYNRYMA